VLRSDSGKVGRVMLKYAGEAGDACSAALGEAAEATGQWKERTTDACYVPLKSCVTSLCMTIQIEVYLC